MRGAARIGLLACLAAGQLACTTHILKTPHEQFEGKFIDQVEPEAAHQKLVGGARSKRALDGQPHAESTLDMFGGWGLMQARGLEKELRRIAGKLLVVYPHEKPDVAIFATSKREFNAYATPYNDIFVSLGLLERVETEDEMAFILGHELAHLALGHFQRGDFFALEGKAMTMAAGASTVAMVFANSDLKEVSGGKRELRVTNTAEVKTNVAYAALAYLAVQELSMSVLSPMWQRHQEDEADLLAIDLMARAGYEPRQAMETLEQLEAIEADKQERKAAALKEVRSTYDDLLLAAGLKEGMDGVVKMGTKLALVEGARTLKDVRDYARNPHRLAVQRREDLKSYFIREYRRRGSLDVSAGPADTFHTRIWSGTSGRVLTNHIAAHEALTALGEDRIADAEELGRRSISGPTYHAPFPRFAMYQIRKSQGRLGSAIKNLEIARKGPNVSGAVLLALGEEYLVVRRPKDALRVVREGVSRFGKEDPFLPIAVAAHGMLRDEEAMEAALARCEETENGDLIERCRSRIPEEMKKEPDPVEIFKKLLQAGG